MEDCFGERLKACGRTVETPLRRDETSRFLEQDAVPFTVYHSSNGETSRSKPLHGLIQPKQVCKLVKTVGATHPYIGFWFSPKKSDHRWVLMSVIKHCFVACAIRTWSRRTWRWMVCQSMAYHSAASLETAPAACAVVICFVS